MDDKYKKSIYNANVQLFNDAKTEIDYLRLERGFKALIPYLDAEKYAKKCAEFAKNINNPNSDQSNLQVEDDNKPSTNVEPSNNNPSNEEYKKCPKCGAIVRQNVRKCQKCNYQFLTEKKKESNLLKPVKEKKKSIIIGSIILIIAVFSFIGISQYNKNRITPKDLIGVWELDPEVNHDIEELVSKGVEREFDFKENGTFTTYFRDENNEQSLINGTYTFSGKNLKLLQEDGEYDQCH